MDEYAQTETKEYLVGINLTIYVRVFAGDEVDAEDQAHDTLVEALEDEFTLERMTTTSITENLHS